MELKTGGGIFCDLMKFSLRKSGEGIGFPPTAVFDYFGSMPGPMNSLRDQYPIGHCHAFSGRHATLWTIPPVEQTERGS
jgi:hypothetical protein